MYWLLQASEKSNELEQAGGGPTLGEPNPIPISKIVPALVNVTVPIKIAHTRQNHLIVLCLR